MTHCQNENITKLVAGMTSLSINTILAALTHRPDQPLDRLLWDVLPLFLCSCSQLAKVGWSRLFPVDGTCNLAPQMFYWTQVRRKSWPRQDLDIVFLKSCNCNPSTVWSCIVLLENRHPDWLAGTEKLLPQELCQCITEQ